MKLVPLRSCGLRRRTKPGGQVFCDLQLNGPAAKVNGFAFNLGVVQGTGRFAGG
jgi:hypothetical protein